MRLGIDFGTTNTSAAVYDGGKLVYIPLDPQNGSEYNLRSMIYVDGHHHVRLGVDAVQTFLREDTGRPVVLAEKMVGTIENTVASPRPVPRSASFVVKNGSKMRASTPGAIPTPVSSTSMATTLRPCEVRTRVRR